MLLVAVYTHNIRFKLNVKWQRKSRIIRIYEHVWTLIILSNNIPFYSM